MTKEEFINKCTDENINITDRNTFVLNYIIDSTNVTDLLMLIKDDDVFDFPQSILESIYYGVINSNSIKNDDIQYTNLVKRTKTIEQYLLAKYWN